MHGSQLGSSPSSTFPSIPPPPPHGGGEPIITPPPRPPVSSCSSSHRCELSRPDEMLASMSYLPSRRAIAVAGKQTYIVAVCDEQAASEEDHGVGATSRVALQKVGSFGTQSVLVEWQPSGSALAVVETGGTIALYDPVIAERVSSTTLSLAPPPQAQQLLATTGASTMSRSWIVTPRVQRTCSVSRSMTAIAWDPHHPHILAHASYACFLDLWDARVSGAATPNHTTRPANCISFSPFRPFIVAVAGGDSVLLFDQRKLNAHLSQIMTAGNCTAVSFHPMYADLLVYSHASLYQRNATICFHNINFRAGDESITFDHTSSPNWEVEKQGPSDALRDIRCTFTQDRIRWRPTGAAPLHVALPPPHHSRSSTYSYQQQLPLVTSPLVVGTRQHANLPRPSLHHMQPHHGSALDVTMGKPTIGSPLWFATCSHSPGSALVIWDSVNSGAPLLSGRSLHCNRDSKGQLNVHSSSRDVLWINPSTLISCGGNSVVACHMEDDQEFYHRRQRPSSPLPCAVGADAPPLWNYPASLPCAAFCSAGFGTYVAVRDRPVLRAHMQSSILNASREGVSTLQPATDNAGSSEMGAASCYALSNSQAASHYVSGVSSVASPGSRSPPILDASQRAGSESERPAPTAKKESGNFFFWRNKSTVSKPQQQQQQNVQLASPPSVPPSLGPTLSPASTQQTPSPSPPTTATAVTTNKTHVDATRGRGTFPYVEELPPPSHFAEAATDILRTWRVPPPPAIIQTFSMQKRNFPLFSNHVVRTTKKQLRRLGKYWASGYEAVVALKKHNGAAGDDAVAADEGDDSRGHAVDDAVGASFLHNRDVCISKARLLHDDPRCSVWATIGEMFNVHNVSLIWALVAKALDYATECGDVQLATFLYNTTLLWWRQRVAAVGGDAVGRCVLLEQEWKQRAYQFVANYAAQLEALEMWTEWSELEYVFPYLVHEGGAAGCTKNHPNPCFRSDVAQEKNRDFLYCSACHGLLTAAQVFPTADGALFSTVGDRRGGAPANGSGAMPFGGNSTTARCKNCRDRVLHVCVICEQAVEGLYLWMKPCGHGGHWKHIQEWMRENDECPKCGVQLVVQPTEDDDDGRGCSFDIWQPVEGAAAAQQAI